MGKLQTTNSLRQKFWIIGGVNKVKAILDKCIVYKKNARPTNQEMADLPSDRATPDNPPILFQWSRFLWTFSKLHSREVEKRYEVVSPA